MTLSKSTRMAFFLAIGLALVGLVVVAGVQQIGNASGIIGGEWTYANNCGCSGTSSETCSNGDDPIYGHCCGGGNTWVCNSGSGGTCGASGFANQCTWVAGGAEPHPNICSDTYDSSCSNDPVYQAA
ncbi:MAG: hypothetical protein ACM359_08755 [Bacillota bacterium]